MILKKLTWPLLRMLLRYIRRQMVNRSWITAGAQTGRRKRSTASVGLSSFCFASYCVY